jgi:hypothetical protein
MAFFHAEAVYEFVLKRGILRERDMLGTSPDRSDPRLAARWAEEGHLQTVQSRIPGRHHQLRIDWK